MTALSRPRLVPVRPLGILAAVVTLAFLSQVALPRASAPTSSVVDPTSGRDPGPDAGLVAGGSTDGERLRQNIAFWSGKAARDPADFVSLTEWAAAEIGLARATGELAAYLRADAILGRAIAADGQYAPARNLRGAVLIALHRFAEARDLATAILRDHPDDPSALASLGDAQNDLGNMPAAGAAYERLAQVAPSAASLARTAQLSFLAGDTAGAIRDAAASVRAANDEGAEPERAAWYRLRLADLRIGTGDPVGAAAAYQDALAADPASFLARAGLARVAAADGRLDDAIRLLSAAIAIVPLPDLLARRADLYTLRAGTGDAARAADDGAAVEAIAQLAGAAGSVYDRTLSLYLANHGLDPARALRLAQAELAVRQDIYGWDAEAWALLAAGRPADADAAMAKALSLGTRDAKLLYHAGMIAAAVGDTPRAQVFLQESLALDPSFDPLQAARARATLAGLR